MAPLRVVAQDPTEKVLEGLSEVRAEIVKEAVIGVVVTVHERAVDKWKSRAFKQRQG